MNKLSLLILALLLSTSVVRSEEPTFMAPPEGFSPMNAAPPANPGNVAPSCPVACRTSSVRADVTNVKAVCSGVRDPEKCSSTRVTVETDCMCTCSAAGGGRCKSPSVRNKRMFVRCEWIANSCRLPASATRADVCGVSAGAVDPCR